MHCRYAAARRAMLSDVDLKSRRGLAGVASSTTRDDGGKTDMLIPQTTRRCDATDDDAVCQSKSSQSKRGTNTNTRMARGAVASVRDEHDSAAAGSASASATPSIIGRQTPEDRKMKPSQVKSSSTELMAPPTSAKGSASTTHPVFAFLAAFLLCGLAVAVQLMAGGFCRNPHITCVLVYASISCMFCPFVVRMLCICSVCLVCFCGCAFLLVRQCTLRRLNSFSSLCLSVCRTHTHTHTHTCRHTWWYYWR